MRHAHLNKPTALFLFETYFLLSLRSIPSLSGDHSWASFTWPTHTPARRETLELNSEEFRVVDGHRVKKCAFWKEFLPRLLDLSKYQFMSYTYPFRLVSLLTLNTCKLFIFAIIKFASFYRSSMNSITYKNLIVMSMFLLQIHVPERNFILILPHLIEL